MDSISNTQLPKTSPATTLPKVVESLGKVVAPTTLVVALLVYFGWTRTRAFYNSLGIHESVLGLTTQDYILGSSAVALVSLEWIFVVFLVVVWIHYGLAWFLLWRGRIWRILISLLFCAAGISGLVISYGNIVPDVILLNVIWTAGFALVGYGVWVAGSIRLSQNPNQTIAEWADSKRMWPAFRYWNKTIIIALVIVGLFVTVAWYANAEGQRAAQVILACPSQRPAATIYSRDPLTLEAPGVVTTQITDDDKAYRYRSTGLRFLIRSNQKYFFLSEVTPAVAIVLPDDTSVRIEFSPRHWLCNIPRNSAVAMMLTSDIREPVIVEDIYSLYTICHSVGRQPRHRRPTTTKW